MTRVSKVESLARVWRRETERARQADFRLAHRFVSEHDAVIVEDLAVANMLRSRLWSRKMSEQRWASFDAVLEYKAWKSDIRFEKVNPSNTSTDCSTCDIGRGCRCPQERSSVAAAGWSSTGTTTQPATYASEAYSPDQKKASRGTGGT